MAYRVDRIGEKMQSPITASEITSYKAFAAGTFGTSFSAGIIDTTQLAGVLNAV